MSLNFLKTGLEKPLILNINLDSHQYCTRSSDAPLMIQHVPAKPSMTAGVFSLCKIDGGAGV